MAGVANNVDVPIESRAMRIYVFTSKTRKNLRAFTDDVSGGKLPPQLGPWRANGAIAADEKSPYRLARNQIEKSINGEGFQLWRVKAKSEEKVD